VIICIFISWFSITSISSMAHRVCTHRTLIIYTYMYTYMHISRNVIGLRFFNPFPANVANKRHLGSAPKSHFWNFDRKNWSEWHVWPNDSFYWPGVFILQTDSKNIQCFKKHTKLIENRFSRSKVIQNSID
jgi:hypothetical protein